MSAEEVTTTYIKCDNSKHDHTQPGGQAKCEDVEMFARIEASKVGWTKVGIEDWCPACSEREALKDVGSVQEG